MNHGSKIIWITDHGRKIIRIIDQGSNNDADYESWFKIIWVMDHIHRSKNDLDYTSSSKNYSDYRQ